MTPVTRSVRELLRRKGRRQWITSRHTSYLRNRFSRTTPRDADRRDDAWIFKTCIYQTACGNICDDSPPVNTTVTLADASSAGANRQEAASRREVARLFLARSNEFIYLFSCLLLFFSALLPAAAGVELQKDEKNVQTAGIARGVCPHCMRVTVWESKGHELKQKYFTTVEKDRPFQGESINIQRRHFWRLLCEEAIMTFQL